MNILAIATVSLFVLGLFTHVIPSTFAQPCENNGHAVLGTGKQLLKQSNHCIIIENNNPSSGICGPNSVLQNGICAPITPPPPITCPIGYTLQNGVCVPNPNPTQSAPVAVPVASPSSTVVGGTIVTLNGLGSYATTSDATLVSYSWVQTSGTPVILGGANTAIASFTAPIVTTTSTLTFSLTVTDSNGRVSAPNSVAVTVTS